MQHTDDLLQDGPPLAQPEIGSSVQLMTAHANKVYFFDPLVRRFERQPDGQKPLKDEGWTEIWAQLSGTTLNIWGMKEIQAASKEGREVLPSYINVADAFVQILHSLTVPATPTVPAKRYANILVLNNVGSNLLLFSCPSAQALISWAASLRLAAWEKSRLEEMYTAHLLRSTFSHRFMDTTLAQGKVEGWVRVRIASHTDWKRLFVVVQEAVDDDGGSDNRVKKRVLNPFSRNNGTSAAAAPPKPLICMYISSKPKDRKKPVLTLHGVTQAYVLYPAADVHPDRPELVNKNTLIKVEGTFGDEALATSRRAQEGWILIMPEVEDGRTQVGEMLRWVVALHDAFKLYGRPDAWIWDPHDPISLMFGCPIGPLKENLCLNREVVEDVDHRNHSTSAIRVEMNKLLLQRLRPAVEVDEPTTYKSPPVNLNIDAIVPKAVFGELTIRRCCTRVDAVQLSPEASSRAAHLFLHLEINILLKLPGNRPDPSGAHLLPALYGTLPMSSVAMSSILMIEDSLHKLCGHLHLPPHYC